MGLQLIDALIIVVLGNDLTPKHLIHHLPGPARHPKIMFQKLLGILRIPAGRARHLRELRPGLWELVDSFAPH